MGVTFCIRTLFGIFLLCFNLASYSKETFSSHGVSFDIPNGWKIVDSDSDKDYFYRYLEKAWNHSEAITVHCALTNYEADTEEWLRETISDMPSLFSFDFNDISKEKYGQYDAHAVSGKGKLLGLFLETQIKAYAFQRSTTSCLVIEQAEINAYKKSKADFTVLENSLAITASSPETETESICKTAPSIEK